MLTMTTAPILTTNRTINYLMTAQIKLKQTIKHLIQQIPLQQPIKQAIITPIIQLKQTIKHLIQRIPLQQPIKQSIITPIVQQRLIKQLITPPKLLPKIIKPPIIIPINLKITLVQAILQEIAVSLGVTTAPKKIRLIKMRLPLPLLLPKQTQQTKI